MKGTGPKNGYLVLISKEELCRLDSKAKLFALLNSLQQQAGFKSVLQVLFINYFLTPLVLFPLFLKLPPEKSGISQ